MSCAPTFCSRRDVTVVHLFVRSFVLLQGCGCLCCICIRNPTHAPYVEYYRSRIYHHPKSNSLSIFYENIPEKSVGPLPTDLRRATALDFVFSPPMPLNNAP